MAFDEHRLPDHIERGAEGGPMFSTTVTTLASGFEQRNQNWTAARLEWDIGYGIQKQAEYKTIIEFFYARRGRAVGFRFKDWADYQVVNEPFAEGNGANTAFQLTKTYYDTDVNGDPLPQSERYVRDITKPVFSTIQLYDYDVLASTASLIAAADYSVNDSTGLVKLDSALATDHELWWTGEFDVPVRFDIDKLGVSLAHFDAGAIPRIPIVEIRL